MHKGNNVIDGDAISIVNFACQNIHSFLRSSSWNDDSIVNWILDTVATDHMTPFDYLLHDKK